MEYYYNKCECISMKYMEEHHREDLLEEIVFTNVKSVECMIKAQWFIN